ncbi:lipase class 2 [Streptomyces albireticuli]|uniref:Lipase class 2 n=1 Tax=Streptomyces albireticuli TaxID=1940 RepID=A0A1Z2LAA1_9ACTN|nr:alpha/beta fold hydrolase [Streptomyces albireticuli]ARZ71224.1 lipase class 2 [Streptomyces albireticuli]
MRRILMAGSALALTAAALGAAPPPAAAVPPPIPVVFVHGRNADPGVWDRMVDDFLAAGYPSDRLYAWAYDTTRSTNETLSDLFAARVAEILSRTGARRVDVVTHSLGALPTRWYVKSGGGEGKVSHWVSLAGPNHGTDLAYLCALWDQGCKDMTPGSYVLRHLNSGDETPGAVRYATWWSSCDEQIAPVESTRLEGARNTRVEGCLKHNELLSDAGVSREVRAFVGS